MAELGLVGKGSNRGPSFKGRYLIYLQNGQIRIQRWPRKRKRKLHSKTIAQNKMFRAAQWLTKYLDGSQMVIAAEATAGTPLLPRDIMTMLMYGRAFGLKFNDGKVFYTMAQRRDISESLDILGSEPGYILQRGADFWTAVPFSGGGGGSGVRYASNFSNMAILETAAHATQANAFIPLVPITVDALIGTFKPLNVGDEYSMFIAEIQTDQKIVTTVATAKDRFTATATPNVTHLFDLPQAVTLNPQINYIVALVLTNQQPTSSARAVMGSGGIGYLTMPTDMGLMQARWSLSAMKVSYNQNSDAPAAGVAPFGATGTRSAALLMRIIG
ncbi:hypothetical protein COW64_17265 [bacterium (Candidatus Blackallbacteria) CG18_big_fil_WC_8_21_14_2_50_49_26]|nr:MAG: hypothetical protein COW64_17265 [bacterium (Candidatus Blackallbacteria) CG18_big_fil_WC_8_21_14_2_50_49_26]